MMTALTAIFGLLPAALSTAIGSQSQRPLAIVVVGGMIATLLLDVPRAGALQLLRSPRASGGERGAGPLIVGFSARSPSHDYPLLEALTGLYPIRDITGTSNMLDKIISGGQTCADQAAWRAAKVFGVPTAGWMPRDF